MSRIGVRQRGQSYTSLPLSPRELKVLIEMLDYALDSAEAELDGVVRSGWTSGKPTEKDLWSHRRAKSQLKRFLWLRSQLDKEPGR